MEASPLIMFSRKLPSCPFPLLFGYNSHQGSPPQMRICLDLFQQKQMSMCPGLYSNIGKKARDVLYKDYAHQPPSHFHYRWLDWNLDFSCQSADIVPGLSTDFRFLIPDSSEVNLQYLRDYVGITAGFELAANPHGGYKPILSFSTVLGSNMIAAGTDLAFDIPTKTLSTVDAGLSFTNSFLAASLTLNDKFDTLKASYYQTVNPLSNSVFAAELQHAFSANGTTLTIGGQHNLFSSMLLKARASTNGRVGALIQQRLWQSLFLTVAGEFDFQARKKVSKIGLSLAFKP